MARAKVRILGIVADHTGTEPGVAYDTLGINGARAARLLGWNAEAFAAAVAERKPDLIILAYGTNESGDSDWTATAYRQTLAAILRRLRSAAPQASFLVYGPPDRADSALPPARLPALVEAERRASPGSWRRLWSSYDAMGGRDSMNAWVGRSLQAGPIIYASDDAGYFRIATILFYRDLMRAYASFSGKPSGAPVE